MVREVVMDYELLASCLWKWGLGIFLLCSMYKIIECDTKIDREDYLQKRDEDGI